ncbi:type II toxin-antitoxin system VapC family toxin [Pandoraea soli]|uniref:Ribonuclease VapC n=1 Tax=Pandoraea soli TaxID=2508293 RepID=A0ABY6W2M2_9BURK|nr:PIN domain-containing protein [Pandoraea soli]VVE18984.1 ribonuclease [Pandoraea soli]
MILVDTSVWIDHLRAGDATLVQLLNAGRVLAHPDVIGELALGSLKNRDVVISTLRDLPCVTVATDDEVLRFIGEQTLFGLGIGYVDAHLLAATRLTAGAAIWTRDKRLGAAAKRLSLAAKILH